LRTALFLAIVVFAGTGGEICTTLAMKRVGEVKDFSPYALLAVLGRAFRVSWMWFGIVLSALAFYAFLALLSWNPVSFVIPVTALSYAAGALGAKFLLREPLSGVRWAVWPWCGPAKGITPWKSGYSPWGCAGRSWHWP